MSGPLEGTVHTVTDGPLSFGRDPANQVMIGDSAVSRKHCAISQVTQGIYEISDLDSHNGTFVNGIQVSRTPIQHGDRIRIGTSEFMFLIGEDNGSSPQSSGAGSRGMARKYQQRSQEPMQWGLPRQSRQSLEPTQLALLH